MRRYVDSQAESFNDPNEVGEDEVSKGGEAESSGE